MLDLPNLPGELRTIAEMLRRQGEDLIVLKIRAAADEIEYLRAITKPSGVK